jgi:hypothetical protein
VASTLLLLSTTASPVSARIDRHQSRAFGPGHCGPADPTYIRTANETGGQPFFLAPTEIANSSHILRATGGDDALILWASRALAGTERDLPIPVDSTVRSVTFSASFDTTGGALTLTGPTDGAAARDALAEDTILNCARIVTIDRPAIGLWQARIVASGTFWLVVHARTDFDIISAEFVRTGGRPGHEGFFRIPGQPLVGERATMRADFSDEKMNDGQLEFVSLEAEPLKSLELTASGADEVVGNVELPDRPFRLSLSGMDPTGHPYQRMYAPLFRAESVEVVAPAGAETLQRGLTTALSFEVRNVGPGATFQVMAADGRFVRRADPATLRIETGESARVTVWLTVPVDTTATETDVTVVASSAGPRATTNGTSLHLTISPP